MTLVLDNDDAFTCNLVQSRGELGAEPSVVRNDQVTVEAVVRADRLMRGKTSEIAQDEFYGRRVQTGLKIDF